MPSALRSFVGSVQASRDRLAAAIAGLLAGYIALTLALAIVPGTQRWMMQRFHLRTESFALWAAVQPSPWMYNFDNRVLVAPRPISRTELQAPPPPLRWEHVNHQPARRFTFVDGRARHIAQPGDHYFYLHSRYRDQHVLSAYHVHVADPPGPSARPASVTRMELP